MEFSAIGYFTKTHGVKGHLILRDESDFETEGLSAFFMDSATGKAPYFIEELNEAGQGLIVKLEEINAVEQAKKLVGKPVYVESNFIIETEEGPDYLGYKLIDAGHGEIGIVSGISDNGQQDLVSIRYKGREVILPLVDEFVDHIDDDKKEIHYAAPEGLIDLYLTDSAEE